MGKIFIYYNLVTGRGGDRCLRGNLLKYRVKLTFFHQKKFEEIKGKYERKGAGGRGLSKGWTNENFERD